MGTECKWYYLSRQVRHLVVTMWVDRWMSMVAMGQEKVLSVHISSILCNVLLSARFIGGPLLQHSDKIYTNAPAISLGHKWWSTELEIENPSQPMRGGNLHPWGPIFFLPKGGGGGGKEIFLEFGVPKYILYGSLCSHQVLKWLFIMFPTAAHFMLYVLPKVVYK